MDGLSADQIAGTARAGGGTVGIVPSLSALGLFMLAALALLVIPGPSVLYIVTRSVEHGRKAGLVSVLGIHTGSMVHVAAAAAGVSALLVASAAAFTTVKLAGAAYLILIGGLRLLRRRAPTVDLADDPAEPPPGASLRRVYVQGVVVNVLNPKTALFFLAFLPQFMDPYRGSVAVQALVLGCVFIALGICSDSTYALVAGSLGERLRNNRHFVRFRDRLSGGVFVLLGVGAALAGHPTRRTT